MSSKRTAGQPAGSAVEEVRRFGEHRNAFGFLRLLFASLVIVSHAPELADGDRRRELLTRLFGTISFGQLAVDGFFLISGYLIVGSFLKQPDARVYLRRRVARIYPAFLVASLVCLLVVAPLAGATPGAMLASAPGGLWRMLTLQTPEVPGVFAGSHHALLDGAMWTIAYEFRCYLLVLALGRLGVFRRPWLVALLAAVLLGAFALVPEQTWRRLGDPLPLSPLWLGMADQTVRLMGVFLAGSLFYLLRDRLRFTWPTIVGALVGLTACMFVQRLAEPGLATFGAWLIFAFAAWGRSGLVSRINNRDDLSYGVYLYAWPATKLLLWWWPTMPVLLVGGLTFVAAWACGWLSWFALEKPLLARLR